MLIAQITDLHIRPYGKPAYGIVDTNQKLKDCVAALQRLQPQPDVLLISGDLTDCGLVEEYEILKDILSPLDLPVYLIPGNHDRRENLRQVFSDQEYLFQDETFIQFAIDNHPVKLIGLDSVVAGKEYGELCSDRLTWLDKTLAARKDEPVVVFMHHPPFPTGLARMDDIKCVSSDAMAEVIRCYPNVERVLCGHHHRPVQVRWAGTLGSIAPATGHQVNLDLDAESQQAMFVMEPAAFHLHLWEPEVGIITHQAYVENAPGPYPFELDPDYPAFADA
ncbi:phosphodiesterase [Rhodovibrionaceae bacterium A322]